MLIGDLRPSTGIHACVVFGLVIALGALSRVADARPPVASTLLAPVTPACVSSPYGPRILPNRPLAGRFHPGIDLPAAAGASVRAVAPGRIIRAQRKGVGGLELLVQHEGFMGVYSHLGQVAPRVAEGHLTVQAGDTIGRIGRTGVTYGTHLYFGMLIDGRPVDPAPYLTVAPCGPAVPQHDAVPPAGDASIEGNTTARLYGRR